jgi:hypothetical protein
MKPNNQEAAPIRALKRRSLSLPFLYVLIGLSGIGLSFILNVNPVFETFFLLISGFLVGGFAERLVKKHVQQGQGSSSKQ